MQLSPDYSDTRIVTAKTEDFKSFFEVGWYLQVVSRNWETGEVTLALLKTEPDEALNAPD